MVGVLLVLIFAAAAFPQGLPGQAPASVPDQANAPAAGATPQPGPRRELPPDAPVITVHGVCPPGKGSDAGNCVTIITKDQFETIVSALTLSLPGQALTPAAMRTFAENYVQSLTLADAAEKAGVDHDLRFEQLMKIMRMRILADAYRHSLQEKYGNPSAQEIEAEYKSNRARFDEVALDRIFIPKFNPKSPREGRTEFENKAQHVANDIRARAARDEDFGKLRAEAYQSLGLTPPPLTTDIGTRRITALPPDVRTQVEHLQAGEVSQVGSQAAGFSIYKVRRRETLPLAEVKGEIVREIYQKKMEQALQAAEAHVHAVYEEQFFGPKAPQPGPVGAKPQPVP